MRLFFIHLVAKILRLLGRCYALMDSEGQPYLIRYVIIGNKPGQGGTFPFNLFLHNICQPDADRYLHSHPWAWAKSRILSGEYVELRPGTARLMEMGSTMKLTPYDYHRIAYVDEDTWTLFSTGHKYKNWGFLVPGHGFVEWSEMTDLSISDWKKL